MANPTYVRGLMDKADYEADMVKLDIRDKIYLLQPEVTPFITILSKMNKLKAVNTEYNWFEDDLLGNYTKANGGETTTETAIVVDDAGMFQEGDIVTSVTSGETMLVKSIDSLTQITVGRSYGTTSAATIANDAYIYKLGSAMQEGYTSPQALQRKKNKKTNYIQIFSKTVQLTETADAVETYGGKRRNYERQNRAIELKREMESQFLWGEKNEDTSGEHPRRTTGGVYEFIASNAPTLDMSSSALTESAFEGWLKDVFLYSGDDRYLFTGPLVASQISQFAAGKQRLDAGSTSKYGVKVNTYHSTMGDIHIVVDRHFIGPHAGKGLALDVKQLWYRYLQGLDWHLELNQQNKKDHYLLDEYSAHAGFEIHNDKLHGIVKGVS